MQFKNRVQLKEFSPSRKKMKGDNGDVYMALLILWLWWPLNLWFVDLVILHKAWHHIRQKHMACGQIETMTTWAIFLPVSCFLYRLDGPKQTEKWSTYMKISEGSLSDLKKRFIEGYGGFQDEARECGIEKKNRFFDWREAQKARPARFSKWQTIHSQLRGWMADLPRIYAGWKRKRLRACRWVFQVNHG